MSWMAAEVWWSPLADLCADAGVSCAVGNSRSAAVYRFVVIHGKQET